MIRVKIRSVAGADLGDKILDRFPVTVGRDSHCGLVITETGVSSKHAELDWDGDYLNVRDLGSRNGTSVNKEKVSQTRIELPCTLTLGNVVILDFMVIEGAGEMVPHKPLALPKPLRRPEPVVTYSAPPEPVRAEVVEEAVVIEGWEMYWHMVKNQSPRPVLLAMIGLAILYGLIHQLVFREGFWFSQGVGFGAAVASAVIAVITAAVMAVPGILFRGKYDFKPLYVQHCLGTMVLSFHVGILRPAFLMDYFGYVAQFLSIPLVAVCSVAGCYMFFFNTFSHKHEKRIMAVAMAVALLAVAAETRNVLKVDRQELMREAFMGKFRTARGLAGSTTEVRAVTEELREFGRKFPSK